MHQYLNTLELVKRMGIHKGDRTGTGTQSHFGQQKRYSLRNNNLPVVTTKKIHLKSIIHELFWMISGDTKVDYLIANGVRIWNEWVKPETAKYVPLTFEETGKAIAKFVGGKYHISFHADQKHPGAVIHHVNDYLEATGMTPPILDDGTELILSVNTHDYGQYRSNVSDYPVDEQYLRIIHHMTIGEPKKLVGGDLGAVYGKVWRDLEDVRIIPKLEWVDYEKRGFEFVVDIPGLDFTQDKAVVKRRIDQLDDVINQLQNSPDSRRIIVCAWAPHLVDEQALPPCHSFFQFWTRELSADERLDHYTDMEDKRIKDQIAAGIMERGQGVPSSVESYRACMDLFRKGRSTIEDYHADLDEKGVPRRALSCQLYQRSTDTFLGLPFNITFYALLTHMLANQCGMVAEEFIWTGGDVHIYDNHVPQTELQLTREPYETPTIRFKPEAVGKDIREIREDDFEILNYESHPHIAGKVAV